MCKYSVDQHLTVLNLYSASNNKILVTEFITVKVSQNLYFCCKICQHSEINNLVGTWFQKSIGKDHRVLYKTKS